MARVAKQPTPLPTSDLDARKAAILEAVVAEHIDTAQPVGSTSVAHRDEVHVSSATIRSEMVALERDGYLMQPHTSAGRVPTDKGYRYFVDHLSSGVLGPTQQHEVSDFFTSVRGEMEDILEQTSGLLSNLTSLTSVVVGPSHARASIRTVQLVDLSPRRVLVVAVLSDGSIEKRTLELDTEVSALDVVEASSQLDALLLGTTLEQRLEVPSRDTSIATLVREAVSALHTSTPTADGDQVFIGGSSKVAGSFDQVETVRKVLGILKQGLVVVSLLQDIMNRGLSVAIGSEHGFATLSSCAVIVAPVLVENESTGAIALLGPTRMNYPEAMAAAEVVSRQLTKRLSSASKDDRG